MIFRPDEFADIETPSTRPSPVHEWLCAASVTCERRADALRGTSTHIKLLEPTLTHAALGGLPPVIEATRKGGAGIDATKAKTNFMKRAMKTSGAGATRRTTDGRRANVAGPGVRR